MILKTSYRRCRSTVSTRELHVDHVTDEVRALLCFNCNGGLGQSGDDVRRLQEAVRYLRWHRPTESPIERRLRRVVPFPRSLVGAPPAEPVEHRHVHRPAAARGQ